MGRFVLIAAIAACGFENRVGDNADSVDAPLEPPAIDAAVDATTTGCGGACDDFDPCTIDACVSDQCVHAQIAVPAGCSGQPRQCAGQASCYLTCTTPRAWQAAEAACVMWGGHLVTITSDPETACVDTWITGQGWIGYYQDANDPEPAGGWEWTSGQISAYTNWQTSGNVQPNNNTDVLPAGQDCAYADGSAQGKWYDHECTASYPYICER